MYIVVSVLLGIFFSVFAFLYYHRYAEKNSKYLKNLHGPTPNLFFGNLLDFIGDSTIILTTMANYMKSYSPTAIFYDGPFKRVVSTIDYKFLEFIMGSMKFIDKADYYKFFHTWLGTGLLTSTGAKWKNRRRLLTPSFHFSILENFIDVFESVGDVFIKKLEKEVGKESVNLHPLVSLCTLDVISEAAMGVSVNAQENENSDYVRSVKTMCQIITDKNFSPLPSFLFPLTLNYFREKKALKILHDHTDSVIDKRIKEIEHIPKGSSEEEFFGKRKMAFLDLLIQCSEEGKFLSRMDIREEVDTFMFEGHDTTSSAISFALFSLALNPEVQNRALEEQIVLFGDFKSAKVTSADLQNMKYLELVIKETLRMYPPVPLFARKVTEDFEYNGTLYPGGMTILLVPYLCHRNPEYFPEPDRFLPERFLDHAMKSPYVYMPFSAGPRNCIGQRFSILEMKSIISKVLRHFELVPVQTPEELRLAPEIILLSKNGVNVRLKKRVL